MSFEFEFDVNIRFTNAALEVAETSLSDYNNATIMAAKSWSITYILDNSRSVFMVSSMFSAKCVDVI